MSMSTLIDDLPDLSDVKSNNLPENIRQDINSLQNEFTHSSSDSPNFGNIKMTKKKVRFVDETESQSFFSIIRNEFSEENTIILLLLAFASLPYMDEYINKISFVQYNSFMSSILKAVILFIIYLVSKIYILPKIKL